MPPRPNQRAFFLIDSLEAAHGTEMLAMILAEELVQRGWQVTFYTADYSPSTSAWSNLLNRVGITVHRPPFRFLRRYLLPHRLTVAKLWQHVRRHAPTLIWSPTNDILTCMALDAVPKPCVPFFVHDPSEAGPACPNYEPLWFRVCNKVTALSVHGERQRHSAISYYGMTKPVEIVRPASLPPRRVSELRISGGRIRFAQFGRLATMKGSIFAVAALADCLARGGDAELHFYGEGPMQQATQELALSLGLKDKVVFHGSYLPEQLDELVEGIDVSLMPSTYEGFGLVMLEVLARGRPVIVTDVGSSREILGESGPGWIVPRANTGALADAMLACCNDPAAVMSKSSQGPLLWAEHFTPSMMASRYLTFWERHGVLLANAQPTAHNPPTSVSDSTLERP